MCMNVLSYKHRRILTKICTCQDMLRVRVKICYVYVSSVHVRVSVRVKICTCQLINYTYCIWKYVQYILRVNSNSITIPHRL
jgi:hypothetical protein